MKTTNNRELIISKEWLPNATTKHPPVPKKTSWESSFQSAPTLKKSSLPSWNPATTKNRKNKSNISRRVCSSNPGRSTNWDTTNRCPITWISPAESSSLSRTTSMTKNWSKRIKNWSTKLTDKTSSDHYYRFSLEYLCFCLNIRVYQFYLFTLDNYYYNGKRRFKVLY